MTTHQTPPSVPTDEMVKAFYGALSELGCHAAIGTLAKEDVIHALTAALAVQPGSGWRPIETAPKDGTRILAWTPAGHDIVWWSDLEPDGPEWPGHNPGWWGACGETAPGRTPEHGFGGNPTYHWPAQSQPTHWQPLHAPPAAQEEN